MTTLSATQSTLFGVKLQGLFAVKNGRAYDLYLRKHGINVYQATVPEDVFLRKREKHWHEYRKYRVIDENTHAEVAASCHSCDGTGWHYNFAHGRVMKCLKCGGEGTV